MQQGLSLIELLIVLAVTGILAAIAYPSYSDQLRRAARSEVVGLLHDAALRLSATAYAPANMPRATRPCPTVPAITACRPCATVTPSRCAPGGCPMG